MRYSISVAATLNKSYQKIENDLAYFASKYVSSILDILAVEMRGQTMYKYVHNKTNLFKELRNTFANIFIWQVTYRSSKIRRNGV